MIYPKELVELYESDLASAVLLLYNKVLELKAKLVLELGVRSGISTRAFLLALKETNGKLISIDIKDYPGTRETIKRMNLDKYWTFIVADDREYYKELDKKFDIIFIDTSHEYKHTLFEIEKYSRFLKPRGVLLLHDTRAKDYPGVKKAILTFLEKHPEWEFKELGSVHGLGQLQRAN